MAGKLVTRKLLLATTITLLVGCSPQEASSDWLTYRSEEFHFSFGYPSSWAVYEEGHFFRKTILVAMNNLGRNNFWPSENFVSVSNLAGGSQVLLEQLPPGGMYFEVGWEGGGPAALPEWYGPEMDSGDLSEVRQGAGWEPWDSEELQRYTLFFDKWGREWNISVYARESVSESNREAIEKVLDSFRFDPVPVGDDRWAALEARKHLPETVHPETFPYYSAVVGGNGYRMTQTRSDGEDVVVTFTFCWDWKEENFDFGSFDPEGCHLWIFLVTASGEVVLKEESGAPPPKFWPIFIAPPRVGPGG